MKACLPNPLHRLPSWCAVLGCLGAFGTGCGDGSTEPRPDSPSLRTPEAVVSALQIAYRAKDIEAYADLLAPEFRFKFQPIDQVVVGSVYWTHDQDSLGTRALFTTPKVSDIRVELTHGLAEPSPEVQHQIDHPGAMRILITGTQLEADEGDTTTWSVKNRQDMYFYKGTEEAGQDTTRWYLFEWRELPLVGAATRVDQEPVPVGQTSWGRVKSWYLD